MIANLSMRLAGKRSVGRRYLAATLFGLALIGVAHPAVAQTTSPPASAPQPSPGALLLAKQIVQVKNVKAVFDPIIPGVVKKTRDLFLQTNFMYQKDIDEVAFNVEKQYAPRVTELVDASARIYATHFTEQELRDLLAFYQSPLGQKALAEEPKVLDQSMVFAGTWADNLSSEIIQAMRVELKKRGHDM
ncbi:MAG TPA: DUF2059 domain-containing protein [Xanthobacteraceae bacterium]|jgi:hypothetical protein|nr:DUF2059 domain-containing protein [Xanthobacteraceae bacterium]